MELVRLAHDAFAGPAIEAGPAAALERTLAAAPVATVLGLDVAFRSRPLHRELGLTFLDPTPAQLDLAAVHEHASVLLGIGTVVRNGFTRQAALERIAGRFDARATAFLLARVADPVPQLGALARTMFEPRLDMQYVAELAMCLPISEQLAQRVRGSSIAGQVRAVLLGDDRRCSAALWHAADDRDRTLRRLALELLVERARGRPEVERPLARALADRDPVIRRRAALLTRERALVPRDVLTGLLSTMAADSSAAVRLVALRARAREGDTAATTAALFDRNAGVRHFARRFLHRQGAAIDGRALALAALVEPAASRERVVGALALLSECGRGEDLALVERFVDDVRRRVATEARRTAALLAAHQQ